MDEIVEAPRLGVVQWVRQHPAILVATFTLCWASVELVASAAGVSSYEVVWTRYGVHLAFMLLAFGPRKGAALVRTTRPASQIAASLLMLGMPLCFIWAMQRVPAHDTMSLLWLAPLLAITASLLLLREHPSPWAWGAAVIGFIGILVIYAPDGSIVQPSALFGVMAALCLALYLVVVRSMRSEPVFTKLFHTALWVFAVLSLFIATVWKTPTIHGIIAMVIIGLLGWTGLYALDTALERSTPAKLAPALYSQVVWEELLTFVHGGVPHSVRLLGGVALVAMAALSTLF